MKRKFFIAILACLFSLTGNAFAGSAAFLRITGAVTQPLNLTLVDLERFKSVQVQLNEVTVKGTYRGVFYYRGVPLRTLLELASIKKKNTNFSKNVDLAILVRNKEGTEVALSWGEVFYRNPAGIIVATSATPIMPHHSCKACHTPAEYKPRLAQLHRKIGFPKLVISGDGFSDRSLDSITSIKVLDLRPNIVKKKQDTLFSPGFRITGAVKNTSYFEDLSGFTHSTVQAKMIGEGKGYHGVRHFEGVSLRSILEKAGVSCGLKTVFLISAPDGYRSLFSYGEVFLNPSGARIIIADRIDKQPIKKGGRFFLVSPDDLMADRDVKSVRQIDVIQLK